MSEKTLEECKKYITELEQEDKRLNAIIISSKDTIANQSRKIALLSDVVVRQQKVIEILIDGVVE